MSTTDFGFDFRATLGFTTDPSYAVAVLGEAYPHTYTNGNGDSIVAGFDVNPSSVQTRDRATTDGPLLAGVNENNGNGNTPSFVSFRVELPLLGLWNIRAAFGDESNSSTQYIQFIESASSFATYTNVSVGVASFMDASGNVLTAANWLTSNASISHLFASNVNLLIQLGPASPTSIESSTIASLRITKATTSPNCTLTVSNLAFENCQNREHVYGQINVTPANGIYPSGGIPFDSVLLANPEVLTKSTVKYTQIQSAAGSGYVYQRIPATGRMMILQVPPNGSLVTGAPLNQIPSSTNMQGIVNDVIEFHATILRS